MSHDRERLPTESEANTASAKDMTGAEPILERLDQALGLLSATVELVLVRRALESVLGDDEVTAAQLRTLRLLASVPRANAGLVIGSIAEGLRISYPAATKAVDRLADRGLAERNRDPADARHTLVRLTARGRALVESVATERRSRLRAIVVELGGAATADRLLQLVEQLVEIALADPADREAVLREAGF